MISVYLLLDCSIRIFFTIAHILIGTIEDLKDRSMRKSIVLLLLCLSFLQLTSNTLTRLLVTLSTKETFFCYSVFIFRPSFVSLLLCLYFILS